MGEQQRIEPDSDLGVESFDEHERDEILEEIDGLVANNRLPISDEINKLTPKKRGIAFPLLINLFAIAAVAGTLYFSNRMFEEKQAVLSLENASYLSAEGKLLEELKKESEEKLKQKDSEIGAIQEELAELDRQSRELADTMEQQIQDREAELREALELELERERQSLQAQGRSEADIEEELRRIELARTTEYEEELAAFKNETEQAIAEKEEELARARALNEELLSEVNLEKERIQDETRQRESELTAQFESEKAALQEEAAAAEEELARITKNQATEALVIDQINGSYRSIFSAINQESYAEALAAIDSLKTMINEPATASLPAVNARRQNDLNILAALKEQIEEQTYKESSDTQSLTAAADLLLSTQEIARLGTEAYNEGNTAAADDYYRRALQKIPAINQAWQNIQEISKSAEAERLAGMIQRAKSLEEEGELETAIVQYASAVETAETLNPGLLQQALDGILETAAARRNKQLSQKDAELAELRTQSSSQVTTLENRLEETERSYIQELAETEKEWQQRLETARVDYESNLADYEDRIAGYESEYAALEEKKEEEIERLTRLVGERDQENLKLSSEKNELEENLSDLQEEIQGLESSIQEAEAEYERLSDEYEVVRENIGSRMRSSEQTGYETGINEGRTSALEDVLLLTSYLEGSAAAGSDSRINSLSEEEPLYGEAVRQIQQVAASGAAASGTDGIAVKQDIFIGSVSYASGSSIIIEPLTEIAIEDGTEIIIKRKERGAAERFIASGKISSSTENRIEAETYIEGAADSPQSLDLVYIVQ